MKKYIVFAISFGIFAFGCGNSKPTEPTIIPKDTAKAEAPTGEEKDFDSFWTRFREAAVAGNFGEVAKRTQFPLQTRGEMDDQPVVTYSESEFEKLFTLFLQMPTGLNANNFNETQLDYIKANPKLSFSDNKLPMMSGENIASVTSMEFEKTPSGWKLKRLFLTDEVYKKTGKTAI